MSRYDFMWTVEVILYNIWLQLDPISVLVKFSHELAHTTTTYDFLLAKQVVLRNVSTDLNLTQFSLWSTFDMNWHNFRTDFNLIKFRFWSTFDMKKNWKNPQHLLVKMGGGLSKWYMGNLNMELNGRRFTQIVDRDCGNLRFAFYTISNIFRRNKIGGGGGGVKQLFVEK